MKKPKEIKIRRTWTRHPAERIKENNKAKDVCEECGAYLTDPFFCQGCEQETEQVGNA
jgi:hypothetical protein